ncbi:hypothetical protein [Kosmotoga pacifica]|uniref:Uncharacterized protein n=1 Tax=Kosmotoga pacifica TaxID=1330330 RepID=A0A0G2Z6B5_9BACT|nr:hypothetical protein [Kosmotoga pacifica]AKI97145.1 hypothetical protein IX53_04190 [Kosmotoga pacifica]
MSRNRKLDMDSLTTLIKQTVRNNENDREEALKEFEEDFFGRKEKSRRKLVKPTRKTRKVNLSKDKSSFEQLLERKDLTSTEKLMLIYLKRATKEEEITISVRTLAGALGINKNTALDTLMSLEMKRLIRKKSTPRGTLVRLLIELEEL